MVANFSCGFSAVIPRMLLCNRKFIATALVRRDAAAGVNPNVAPFNSFGTCS